MRIAYGDSYGGVAQHELALDAARDSRYFDSLRLRMAMEAAARDEEQRALANMLSMGQTAESNRRYYRDELPMAQQKQQYGFLEKLLENKRLYDKMSADERLAGLDLQAAQVRDAQRTGEADYSEAADMIGQGMPPEQVNSLFSLKPPQQARLAALFSQLARQEEQDLAPAETTARDNQTMLQASLDQRRRTKAEQKALEEFTPFTRDSTIKKRIANMSVKDLPKLDTETFNSFIQEMILKQKLESLLRGDPETQRIEMIPQPRRFRSFSPPGLDPVSNPGLAASAVGPMVPPAAGLQSGSTGGTIMPTSRAEFDALPRGTMYINPADGKIYRKK